MATIKQLQLFQAGCLVLVTLLIFGLPTNCVSGNPISQQDIIEGDILLDETTAFAVTGFKKSASRRRREIVRDDIKLWDGAVIPYVISDKIDVHARKYIRQAFRQITRKTCITFIPKQDRHTDYVKFITNNGCYSSVGKKGGEQVISLGEGCLDKGNVIHEIMHTLGFFHEHSRFDRDKYIKVLWWNVRTGLERNFLTYSHETTDNLNEPYDYSSIMHYRNKAFSNNGRDTIQSKFNPYLRLGGKKTLSRVDKRQLHKLYDCTHRTKQVLCHNMSKLCWRYSATSDLCESSYPFMNMFCKRACAFCCELLIMFDRDYMTYLYIGNTTFHKLCVQS